MSSRETKSWPKERFRSPNGRSEIGGDLLLSRGAFPNVAGILLFIHLILVVFSFIKYLSGNSVWGFALVGVLCSAIVLAPFLDRVFGFLSLWGVLWLVVFIGAGVRGVMISASWPDRQSIESLFLVGKEFNDFKVASVVVVLCICGLTAGYYFSLRGYVRGFRNGCRPVRRFGPDTSDVPGALVLALIWGYAIVGCVSTVMYTVSVGGLDASISDRRTTFTGDSSFQSYGVLSFLAGSGVMALMLYFAYRLQISRKFRVWDVVIAAVLVVNAFALNFVTTTRTDLLFVSIGVLFVIFSVRGRVPVVATVLGAIGLIIGISVLTAERGNSSIERGRLLSFGIESGLLNRNAFDLSKTLQVITAVPEVLPYQLGSTIYTYVFAPIPRIIWPNKPLVSPGPIIGQTLYDLPRTGVPPGMIAELVWNFGIAAALVLVPVTGYWLGRMEGWALSFNRYDISFLLAYATIILPFGKALLGVAVGQAFSASLQAAVLLCPAVLAFLMFSKSRVSHSDSSYSSSRL